VSDKLSNHLSKYRNITPPDDFTREYVSKILKKKLKISINKKQISIRNNVLYIETEPVYKNEVFLKKEKLLEAINEISKKKIIKDIR